jgi:hypothetical protein
MMGDYLWKKVRALLIIALASSGCVSVRATTSPGTNLADYRAWTWAEPRDASERDLRASPAGQIIREQIARDLEARGMRQVAGAQPPDFLVDFDYVAEDKLARARQGYGWGYHAGVYGGMSREGGQVREYSEGTVIVDFIDTKTREIIWRGTAVSTIDRPENPRLDKLAKAVDKVMQRL